MNIYPSFTNIRAHLAHKFFTLRTNARREALWAKLTGRSTRLASFPEECPEKSPNRKFLGTTDIRVEQIVGTINRHADFDNKFRPINKHLLERWINIHLMLEREGWTPILVHQVGEMYYVEDGHHRVSVAQALGLTFIQAKVWDYPVTRKASQSCEAEPCPEVNSARVYAGGIAD